MTTQEMERVKRAVIRKYPIFGNVALLNTPIEADDKIKTAQIWGEEDKKGNIKLKGIKYNPSFFDNLTFGQQVFVLAHEVCHIAFKHFERSVDKPKKDIERKYQEYCLKEQDERLQKIEYVRLHKKYNNIWNIATDACINAFLTKDGLEFPENVVDKKTGEVMQFVNIKDGLYRSAEHIYDELVKREEQKVEEKGNDNSIEEKNKEASNQNSDRKKSFGDEVDDGIDDFDIDDYQGIDSHEEWVRDSASNKEQGDSSKEKQSKSLREKIKELFSSKSKEKEYEKTSIENIPNDEPSVFKENEYKRDEREQKTPNDALNNINKESGLLDIKPAKPVVSWKQLLIRSVEEENEMWGYRRASRNMPNARIEDRIEEERAITEVVLDTSGSVSNTLLRAFIRQVLTMFKHTDIKVGCFGTGFSGFTEIRNINQAENFQITRYGGTDFEVAASAFTKEKGNKKINKIVFTDGVLGSAQKTPANDIIWIVFGKGMNFSPLGGKIIRVDEKDLNEMLSIVQVNLCNIRYVQEDEMEKRR